MEHCTTIKIIKKICNSKFKCTSDGLVAFFFIQKYFCTYIKAHFIRKNKHVQASSKSN